MRDHDEDLEERLDADLERRGQRFEVADDKARGALDWKPIGLSEVLKLVRRFHDYEGGPKALLAGRELTCGRQRVRKATSATVPEADGRRKCSEAKGDGDPCGAWATRESEPPRCSAHQRQALESEAAAKGDDATGAIGER